MKKQKAARFLFNKQIEQNMIEPEELAYDDEMDDFFPESEVQAQQEIPQQSIQQELQMPLNPMPQPLSQSLINRKKEPKPQQLQKPQIKKNLPILNQVTSEELQQEKGELIIRETGWLWKTVVIPPNAYVVHTRRGCKKPITLGLGTSFRYRPRTDSYLVVPAAMQTIGIVAQGISREKQGVNILAYVQWLISDFSIAYKKWDFGDPKDPMGIINAQLREQAEAAIKDKISTMSVEEILTDKAPIIEELITRMKTVAEGSHREEEIGGLGIRIVNVQIKEAFVSSQKLWALLQTPFRNEREREARLSRLRIEEEVTQQELTNRKKIKSAESQTFSEIAQIEAEKESESFKVIVRERSSRKELEAKENEQRIQIEEQRLLSEEASKQRLQEQKVKNQQALSLLKLENEQKLLLENAKKAAEMKLQQKEIEVQNRLKEIEMREKLLLEEHECRLKELERKELIRNQERESELKNEKHRLEIESLQQVYKIQNEEKIFMSLKKQEEESNRIADQQKQHELELAEKRQEISNLISNNDLMSRMIQILPELAKAMPDIHELKTLQISSDGQDGGFDLLAGFLSKLFAVAQTLGFKKNESVEVK